METTLSRQSSANIRPVGAVAILILFAFSIPPKEQRNNDILSWYGSLAPISVVGEFKNAHEHHNHSSIRVIIIIIIP